MSSSLSSFGRGCSHHAVLNTSELHNQTLFLFFFFSFFLNSSSRKLPPVPYLQEKQAHSKMPQGILWLLDPGHRQCLVWFPSQGPGTAHGRCPGNGIAQELFPIQRGTSLLLPPPWSFGAGHEDEICFNPKANPSEERVSSSFIPHLEVGTSPSHEEIQPRRGIDLPAL